MWILFVIDHIVNTHAKDEIKYVHYNTYTEELDCIEEAIRLYREEFTQYQEAICVQWNVFS